MRVLIDGHELAAATAWAGKFIPARPTTPVLGGMLLRAETDLTMAGYDYDTAGTVLPVATVTEPGEMVVSARLLAAVAKTLRPADQVDLTRTGTTLTVTVGRSTWELPALDERDYPKLPDPGEAVGAVDSDTLAAALARVLPAASDPAAAPFHSAVAVSATGGVLTIATTDRHRLAVAELGWDGDDLAEVLVPADMLRTASRDKGGLTRLHTGSGFAATGERHSVVGRTVDTSMAWRAIDVPAGADRSVLDVAELRQAVDRATVVCDDAEPLTLHLDSDGATVAPTVGGKGRATHHCAVTSHEGDGATVGCKTKYLRDGLDALDSPHVTLAYPARAWAPVLLLPTTADGEIIPGFRYVLAQQRMPSTARSAAA